VYQHLYLEEQKVTDLSRAASSADDYKLTHRSSNSAPESKPVKTGNNVHSIRSQQRGVHGQLSVPTCVYCKKRGHLMSECWILQKKEQKNPPSNHLAPFPHPRRQAAINLLFLLDI